MGGGGGGGGGGGSLSSSGVGYWSSSHLAVQLSRLSALPPCGHGRNRRKRQEGEARQEARERQLWIARHLHNARVVDRRPVARQKHCVADLRLWCCHLPLSLRPPREVGSRGGGAEGGAGVRGGGGGGLKQSG